MPGATSIWAPDVAFFGGQYHLYYAVSTYGSQRSVIGLATNTTLDPANPAYRWVDHGPVIASRPGGRFNAIDPNVLVDGSGNAWLTFGSRWAGIEQVRLDPATGLPSQAHASRALVGRRQTRTVAARPDGVTIEAPFLFEHNGEYYLFVSAGNCCAGVDSTYEILVGRSTSPSGRFLDRLGRPMTRGGGTRVLGSGGGLIGPGSASVLADGSGDWIDFQAYDKSNADQPALSGPTTDLDRPRMAGCRGRKPVNCSCFPEVHAILSGLPLSQQDSSAGERVVHDCREAARLSRVDGECPVFVLRQEANVYGHIADDGHLVTTVAVGLRHEQRVIDRSGGADFFPWLEAMDRIQGSNSRGLRVRWMFVAAAHRDRRTNCWTLAVRGSLRTLFTNGNPSHFACHVRYRHIRDRAAQSAGGKERQLKVTPQAHVPIS